MECKQALPEAEGSLQFQGFGSPDARDEMSGVLGVRGKFDPLIWYQQGWHGRFS
jgi:hypothetical protein